MRYGHGGDLYTYNGILDFSANINPFGPSEYVMEAACGAVREMGCYPDSQCRDLRKKLEMKLKIPQGQILCGNGAADLIFSLVFAEKPKRALLAVPAFSEYEQALRAVGCEIVYDYLEAGEQFAVQDNYLERLTGDIDIIFLCSPNNPTGRTIRRDLLVRILEQCERSRIRVVVDECFNEFLEQPEQATMQAYVAEHSRLILLRAFTKIHAMPGLRLGYMLCSDEQLMENIQAARQPWSVSGIAQAAGIAALDEDGRVLDTRRYVAEERRKMETELGKMGIEYIPSEANYILLHMEQDGSLFETMLNRGILIRDCQNYAGLSKGYYRIAVKRREENEKLLGVLREISRKG